MTVSTAIMILTGLILPGHDDYCDARALDRADDDDDDDDEDDEDEDQDEVEDDAGDGDHHDHACRDENCNRVMMSLKKVFL